MITRYPTREPHPVSRSVFDVTYTRRPHGRLAAMCLAGLVIVIAVVCIAATR